MRHFSAESPHLGYCGVHIGSCLEISHAAPKLHVVIFLERAGGCFELLSRAQRAIANTCEDNVGDLVEGEPLSLLAGIPDHSAPALLELLGEIKIGRVLCRLLIKIRSSLLAVLSKVIQISSEALKLEAE